MRSLVIVGWACSAIVEAGAVGQRNRFKDVAALENHLLLPQNSMLGEPKYGPGSEPQWKAGRNRYPAFYKALLEELSRTKQREMLVADQRSTRHQ